MNLGFACYCLSRYASRFMKTSFLFLVLSFFSATLGWSAVTLPNVIGDNMVLQRDLPVPIWGWAEAGEQVTISFAGQSKTTLAGEDGNWMVTLDKLSANSEPASLSIKASNDIMLQNILVGEVWLCSGQSNMEWHVRQCANPQEEIANANYPQIRLFDVPGHTVHPIPQRKGHGQLAGLLARYHSHFQCHRILFWTPSAQGTECTRRADWFQLGGHPN
jgi:hypothetical protein